MSNKSALDFISKVIAKTNPKQPDVHSTDHDTFSKATC